MSSIKNVFVRHTLLSVIIAGLALAVGGCATSSTNRDTITQVATIDSLLAGAYDGSMTLHELLQHGDFGIGTFDQLDGEMIVLNGRVWQVRADGSIHAPELTTTTPFASVVRFDPDMTIKVDRINSYADLQARINACGLNSNLMHGVRVRGRIISVKTRSVPAQRKPYPPLAEVTRDQPEFNAVNIMGTLVGFRLPAYVGGINVPGYHLHCLSDDRTFGGHLLECVMEDVTIEIDICHRFLMVLPADSEEFGQADLSIDRAETLRQVEH